MTSARKFGTNQTSLAPGRASSRPRLRRGLGEFGRGVRLLVQRLMTTQQPALIEATREARLEPVLQRRFEAWFQEDPSSLRLIFFKAPDVSSGMPRAFSFGAHVFLAPTMPYATRAEAEYMLAHEMAHVVQRLRARASRRTLASIPGDVFEREANAAAAAFITGSLCPPLSQDIAAVPRAWGPSGHYY